MNIKYLCHFYTKWSKNILFYRVVFDDFSSTTLMSVRIEDPIRMSSLQEWTITLFIVGNEMSGKVSANEINLNVKV
jgi:hypothetical protein